MSRYQKDAQDDELVIRYLLGTVTPNEAERLDELSIADEEFASCLTAVENDLVDAYVRGELSGEKLAQFKAVYLSSPARRQKVAFAESLAQVADREGTAEKAKSKVAGFPRWALAAAACLVLSAGGLLLYRAGQPAARPAPKERRQANAAPPPVQPSPPAPAPHAPVVVAMVLRPQLRGAGSVPTLKLPPKTDRALFHLELESDEFAGYRAGLRNPATNQVVWQSGVLHSAARGDARTVSVSIPDATFETGNYTLELMGIGAGQSHEFAGSYTFRVER